MPHMLWLPTRLFTTRHSARRWRLALTWAMVLWGCAMTHNASAQVGAQGQRAQVKQSIWIDESQQLDFESARTQEFKSFNALERLAIGDRVVWLRLHIEQTDATGPLFLHLLPAHLGYVTLYSPAGSGHWHQRTVAPQDFISKTEMGAASQGDDFYLRIYSRHNAAVVAFVASKDELSLHERKMAVAMTVFSTLSLLFLFVMVWRSVRKFSWMSLLVCVLLVSTQIQFWTGMGYAVTFLGLPVQWSMALASPTIIANIAIAGGIFIIFSTTLFPNQRWLRWIWVWPVMQMGFCVYALFEPSAASNSSMLLWRLGTLALAACLLVAAVREPRSLSETSARLTFGVLLLVIVMTVFVSWQSGGILGGASQALTSDLFLKNIFSRFAMLLVIIGLASWFYERLKVGQFHAVQSALKVSQENLDLESKRLERQRKFTAMLAHELKNPLAVSHLALSGIKSRMGQDEPLLARSAAIERSLEEIDAIIERCSEVDGFEQGQLPMSIAPFTLNDLIAAIKASNSSERIYFLVQGISGDAVLVSDMHYLKIILSNLLTNALKYSPPDTLVELAVQTVNQQEQSPSVAFSVSNEVGEAGTPSAELVFNRFYRAESARNQSGAGLGLWLSQALAHALGTEVVMQTNQEKISFTLVLPIK